MRFVVVLSPEHKGVYSYDPDNGSSSAVAVASDNSVRRLPWSLDECAQNGLGFVVLPSFQKAKDLIINLNRIEDGCSSLLSVHACMNDLLFKLMDPVTRHEFSRTTKCIELMRDWGHWPEIADTLLFKDRVAMNLVVDWLNLISPQHHVRATAIRRNVWQVLTILSLSVCGCCVCTYTFMFVLRAQQDYFGNTECKTLTKLWTCTKRTSSSWCRSSCPV